MGEELDKAKLYLEVDGEMKELGFLSDAVDVDVASDVNEHEEKTDYSQLSGEFEISLNAKDAKKLKRLIPKTKKERRILEDYNKKQFNNFIRRK